ncbi:MAG: hypothetical protein JO079_08055 [Frankiaceae bacterium]|nr:hypothetical protein [Frankiaceae bacterium]MBV9368355.1 hypothetical protein [Frankiales bacterium]
MPPRKKAPAGPPALTDGDVTDLRARLSAGEKPRVVVRTASAAVPAGTRGNVVRIGNPADGEFIVVRLGRDEVPFAPSELAVGGRGGRTAAAPVAPPPAAAKKAPAPAPVKKAAPPPAPVKKAAPPPAPAKKAPAPRAKKASAARKALPPLVVTLRFTDGDWTVEASRGARRVSKAVAVRPGAVKAFADLVEDGAVREALTETIESCRSVVEERAAALRAELQAAEAALKDYEARRR